MTTSVPPHLNNVADEFKSQGCFAYDRSSAKTAQYSGVMVRPHTRRHPLQRIQRRGSATSMN
jgi:hypothetical protein